MYEDGKEIIDTTVHKEGLQGGRLGVFTMSQEQVQHSKLISIKDLLKEQKILIGVMVCFEHCLSHKKTFVRIYIL